MGGRVELMIPGQHFSSAFPCNLRTNMSRPPAGSVGSFE